MPREASGWTGREGRVTKVQGEIARGVRTEGAKVSGAPGTLDMVSCLVARMTTRTRLWFFFSLLGLR